MTVMERAQKLRPIIEKAMQSVDDATALEAACLFRAWDGNSVSYTTGTRLKDEGVLYRVLQDHTSQADWKPAAAPSLFAKVLIPDPETVPEWEQPDSTNPYAKGDKVTHNGKTWVSSIDGNVWEPGVYGWTEVTA